MTEQDPQDPQALDNSTGRPAVSQSGTWRARIEACKNYRKKLIPNWMVNIDYRRGKPYSSQTDEDRIVVPIDWSRTKSKEAALFSQVPKVRVNHPPQSVMAGPWVFQYEQRLNDTLVVAGIETCMEECLPDVINASGFAAALVSHEVMMEDVEIPKIDLKTLPPELVDQVQQSKTLPDGTPLFEVVPRVVDHRYLITRISPADLLWPISFNGGDFEKAPWIGRSGRVSWAQAVQLFKLTEADRSTVCGDSRSFNDRLTHDIDKDKILPEEVVGFDEIYYKEFEFDAKATSYYTIKRLVFVNGKEEPVITEAWKGQKVDPETKVLTGSLKYPIRVLTLTYLTDEAIPPSDSSVGRSQVNEINKGRTQAILQRERSIPLRWFNVDRVDTSIQQAMMRGTWQSMIPVQGNGDSIIGEVARANYPQDNWTFDQVAKSDLDEAWLSGPNQQGAFGEGSTTASESKIVQSNFSTRVSKERAKVAKFVVSIAEVLGGLLCLFEDPASFGEGYDASVCKTLSYSILPDSTIILDVNTRREQIKDFINFAAKSGYVDVEVVLKEYAQLSGLDPNIVIKAPQPKPPSEPTISLRLTGIEDLMNPLALATLMKSGQAPPPELIEAAKRCIQQAIMPPAVGPNMQGQGPQGPDGQPLPGGGPPPPEGLAGPGGPLAVHTMPAPPQPPLAPPHRVGEAHPQWSALDRINKRVLDR